MACSTCIGRYRVQSESPRQRTERRAHKILSKAVFDDSQPDGRIRYRKRSVHTRLREKAIWAANIIFERDELLIESIKKTDKPMSKKRKHCNIF